MSTEINAEAFLRRLAERGVDYLFANAGTDFASIVEAIARNNGQVRYPRAITVPHENVAMAMAHGYYRTCGKPAAVMVHVNVGTANAMCGLMNAQRDNIPVFLAAGRTPLTETGSVASRNRSIHWGQEMFDQGAMVRELVKWDYELRSRQPVDTIVDRALDIAMTEPRGPIYLTLPRETLGEPAVGGQRPERALGVPPVVASDAVIGEAARMIAQAEFPLIITSASGRYPGAVEALARLASRFALPVVQNETRDLNLPTDHPMHVGFESSRWLPKADVILVIESVVPWMPKNVQPKPGAKIIRMSSDPLAVRYPFRDMDADLLIGGDVVAALVALKDALAEECKSQTAVIERRRQDAEKAHATLAEQRAALLEKARTGSPIHPAWVDHCVNERKAKDAIVISELGLAPTNLDLTAPGSYMGNLMSGGLGFGLGAALGAKLAAPEREVITSVGDGSYMFGNPLPFHYVAQAENLPVLTIINNNQSWHAVRRATLDIYPDGHAAKANIMPLTELKPSPAFEKTIEACGGYGEAVSDPQKLPAALDRAFDKVRSGTPALLNVISRTR